MLPALIVFAEFACANFIYGFPWFSFALINSNNILGTTLVFYFGSLGLSYVTILIFLCPCIVLIKNNKNKKLFFYKYLGIFFIILVMIIFKTQKNNDEESNYLSITLVQLNYPMNQHLSLQGKENKLKMITQIINKSKSEIVIFSENEFPFLMNSENIKFIQKILKQNQKLIIGSIREESSEYYNSLFVIDNNNYQYFDKKILVPFGEFIPFRYFFNFMEFIAGSIDFSKGSNERYIKIKNDFIILPVICYEIIYYSRLIKTNNTNVIINLTNDSWFGNFLGPYQHYYFAKLRAAEFNKPIIRVSNNGISGVIDNNGLIKNYIKLNKFGVLNLDIIKKDINKNYLRFHKIFFLLIMMSFLLGLILNKKND